jgi:hypothetical protein
VYENASASDVPLPCDAHLIHPSQRIPHANR